MLTGFAEIWWLVCNLTRQGWRIISLKSDVVCQSYRNVYRGTVFSWTRCSSHVNDSNSAVYGTQSKNTILTPDFQIFASTFFSLKYAFWLDSSKYGLIVGTMTRRLSVVVVVVYIKNTITSKYIVRTKLCSSGRKGQGGTYTCPLTDTW